VALRPDKVTPEMFSQETEKLVKWASKLPHMLRKIEGGLENEIKLCNDTIEEQKRANQDLIKALPVKSINPSKFNKIVNEYNKYINEKGAITHSNQQSLKNITEHFNKLSNISNQFEAIKKELENEAKKVNKIFEGIGAFNTLNDFDTLMDTFTDIGMKNKSENTL
jgi:predicted RNase H-like nuclease (RuvC/YqgF family)